MPTIEIVTTAAECMIDAISADQPCPDPAQWRWAPEDECPVDLCGNHAAPLIATPPGKVDGWFGRLEDWRA